jgi:hypothetical protein
MALERTSIVDVVTRKPCEYASQMKNEPLRFKHGLNKNTSFL